MPYAALLVALIIQLYLNACIYETGWAFGSRRLDNAIPVFAAGLAALFVRMQRVWHRRLAIGIAGIAIVWNFLFALQYGGILDGLYMQRAYAHYASEYRVSMDSLLETNCLPDGTPIDPNACIFPRAGGATLEQFTYDKLLVIQMIAHHLFGARLPK